MFPVLGKSARHEKSPFQELLSPVNVSCALWCQNAGKKTDYDQLSTDVILNSFT